MICPLFVAKLMFWWLLSVERKWLVAIGSNLGAIVIDVGMNRDSNGKLCGDVDTVVGGRARVFYYARTWRRWAHDDCLFTPEHGPSGSRQEAVAVGRRERDCLSTQQP